MTRLRTSYDLKPLVIHTNYLVNLASTNQLFLEKSIEAFRGEIERALAVCADYLVLHPAPSAAPIAKPACCRPLPPSPLLLRISTSLPQALPS